MFKWCLLWIWRWVRCMSYHSGICIGLIDAPMSWTQVQSEVTVTGSVKLCPLPWGNTNSLVGRQLYVNRLKTHPCTRTSACPLRFKERMQILLKNSACSPFLHNKMRSTTALNMNEKRKKSSGLNEAQGTKTLQNATSWVYTASEQECLLSSISTGHFRPSYRKSLLQAKREREILIPT